MNSSHFGRSTWNSLILFNFNSIFAIRNIEVYLTLTEGSYVATVLKEKKGDDLIRYKQYIVLDCIAKLETIIETLIVLIHCLSDGYGTVSENLSYYDPQLPRQIQAKTIQTDYNIRRVFGLPNPKKLGLSHLERQVMLNCFSIHRQMNAPALIDLQ